jgi:hypothetical protein
MKKMLLVLAMSALSLSAKANILRCDFTEPFFNITYNSKTKVTTYTGVELYNEETQGFDEIVIGKESKLIPVDNSRGAKGSQYVLVNEEGKVLLKLKLSFNGSNGMSDHTYPFEAWYGEFIGACDTKNTPAVETYELIDSLL